MFNEIVNSTIVTTDDRLAETTIKTHQGYLKSYERRIRSLQEEDLTIPEPFPVTDPLLRFYIESLKREGTCWATIRCALSAFVYHFAKEGTADLTKTTAFQNYIFTIKRVVGVGVQPNVKQPVTTTQLNRITRQCLLDNTNGKRDLALISTLFFAFLRVSEALALRRADLTFDEEKVTIQIVESKTDQTKKGIRTYVHRSEKMYCCYVHLNVYLDEQKMGPDDVVFPFSPQQVTRILRKRLTQTGVPPHEVKSYSSHSMRKGGAHEAALRGIPDYVIKVHGRWRSDCCQVYTNINSREAAVQITLKI